MRKLLVMAVALIVSVPILFANTALAQKGTYKKCQSPSARCAVASGGSCNQSTGWWTRGDKARFDRCMRGS